jgi:hypothetical protein
MAGAVSATQLEQSARLEAYLDALALVRELDRAIRRINPEPAEEKRTAPGVAA